MFAIAVTLLVLDLKVPHGAEGTLATVLVNQWPAYLAFVTSFMTILVMWVSHHRMFGQLGRVSDALMLYNGLLLLGVTLVPFPTALVAEYLGHPGQRLAAAVYNGLFIVIALFFNLLWRGAARRLLRHNADPAVVRAIDGSYRFGWLYVVAFALAFVNVAASLALNLGLAVYFALPASAHVRDENPSAPTR